jgi:uncharacterized membrane protein
VRVNVRRVNASFRGVNFLVALPIIIYFMLTSVKLVFRIAIPRSMIIILNLPFLIGVRSSDICTSMMSLTCIVHGEIGLNLLFGS